MIFFKQRPLSLKKCRKILQQAFIRYKKIAQRLSNFDRTGFEASIEHLHTAIEKQESANAENEAKKIQTFLDTKGKRRPIEYFTELLFALLFAICFAGIIRQVWFELYEIPTGSMRPTYKESDQLVVSKTSFGINIPFMTAQFHFDPLTIKRGQTVVFTGDTLPIPDVDTRYFGIFPGKRQYVKRCIALPQDTVYFYGGKIWGIDKEKKEITEYQQSPFNTLEHIPFITFEGSQETDFFLEENNRREIILKHFGISIGQIILSKDDSWTSRIAQGNHWIEEGQKNNPLHFYDFFGIKNYAICRLIEPHELPHEARRSGYEHSNAIAYLELEHHPTLIDKSHNQSLVKIGVTSPFLQTRTTWIALDKHAIEKIKSALYTSRFVIEKGFAKRYNRLQDSASSRAKLFLSHAIPNGTYEFFNGTAYELDGFSRTHALPKHHPLYPKNIKDIKVLFNSGIEFQPITNAALSKKQIRKERLIAYPARFAYYKNGALYTMNSEILPNTSDLLSFFQTKESSRIHDKKGYIPFIDESIFMKDGSLNIELIERHGVKVPENCYLCLGDNHAVSADCRFFGFIPENTLKGSPIIQYWPLDTRAGLIEQPAAAFMRISNILVLSLVALVSYIIYKYTQKMHSYSQYIQIKQKLHTNKLGKQH